MTDQIGVDPEVETPSKDVHLEGMAGDSMSVAGWTIASRVTGFIRVAAIAAVLGPTFFGNLFEATNLLPNLAFELLTGPLIAAMLVPHLVRIIDARRGSDEQRLAGGFLGVVMLIFAAATTLVILAGSIVLNLLTILVPDAAVRADQLNVGWPLLAMLMPQALFYALASIGVAVQNAHRRFALAAAAPAVENVGIIIVMAVSAGLYGFGIEVDEVSTAQLVLLGLGTTGSVAAHAAVQWWGARRVGVTLIPRAGWRDPEVRSILRVAVPSSGFAIMTATRTIGLLVAAGSLPGGVVAFQLGRYFFNFPVAIAARPVIAAQLPRLSRAAGDRTGPHFHTIYRSGVNLILFAAVPASLMMIALAGPLARAAAYGGMASNRGITLATAAIGTLAAGIVGESLFLTATSAFYARRNARTPLVATSIRLGLTAVGAVFAVTLGDGVGILVILGLSVAFGDLVTGYGLHRALQRGLPKQLGPAGRLDRLIGLVIAGVAVGAGMGAAGLAGRAGLPGRLTDAAIGAATVGVTYLFLQQLRGSPELDELIGVFRNSEHA